MNKNFFEKYLEITKPILDDLKKLDTFYENLFCSFADEKISSVLKKFLSHKGKQLRPVMIFLLMHALKRSGEDFYYNLALSNELLHNATLIHDDIIDCSLLRRGQKTLNLEYDSKLAVLAGDYLLSEVLKIFSQIDDEQIRTLHTDTISNLISGELFQYFHRFKLLSIDEYIEKSKNKTARLFEAGLVSTYLYKNKDDKFVENVRNFALNFGIGFQIDNDLKSVENAVKVSEDIKNGDYGAPVIFYSQEYPVESVKTTENLLNLLKNSAAIEKTIALKNKYINMAIENLEFIEDNQYKDSILKLCKLYTE